MSSYPSRRPSTRRILVLMFLCLGLAVSAVAQKEQVIYNFTNVANLAPNVTADSAGNLYGTLWGQFTVFQLSPATSGGWTYTALGQSPGNVSSLAVDKSGNVFGTTETGGIVTPICPQGCGTVFEFSQVGGSWQEVTIFQFAQGAGNQIAPTPLGITIGKNGVLYAAAKYAGKFGAVYALVPQSGGAWKLVLVYQFMGSSDGEYPNGSFALDTQGNLYGTTLAGGVDTANCDDGTGFTTCGTVFKLTPPVSGGPWTKTTLYEFTGPPNDGNFPNGGLLRDASGDIYGTTRFGGASFTDQGTAFKLTPSGGTWTETVLHSFSNKPDGYEPIGLTAVPGGVLYGVTWAGGAYSGGSVFQLANSGGTWSEKVVYSFQQGAPPQGSDPDTNLVYLSGALYGATSGGGTGSGTACSGGDHGCGVVYQLTK
jgi:uncharacterized repeat protein (TIGR03803 family)